MRSYLLKNGHAIDPNCGLDNITSILVRDGSITAFDDEAEQLAANCEADSIDCTGKLILPGLFDMHVHFREPGYEQKETIATGSAAAIAGGFTGVCCMPNTNPICDNATTLEFIQQRAEKTAHCKIYVAGACTKGEDGESLSSMGDMFAHGAVAFSDDGRGVQNSAVMRRVMSYASQFGTPILSHCQDENLSKGGQVNEGVCSTRLGLLGWPAAAEEIQIERDIALCRLTGCSLHIQHISTARGLDLVRRAKDEGLPVTCEVTPHHLFLDDSCIHDDYNTFLKVNPPLRTREDCQALQEGLIRGDIDAIVTDHAPHTASEKDLEFERAPFGMIGLETSLASINENLIRTNRFTWADVVTYMSINPRAILSITPVSLRVGACADICVYDPHYEWVVGENGYASKASNCGFAGMTLHGKPTLVLVEGQAALYDGVVDNSVYPNMNYSKFL